jgi:hypothetical protein
MQSRLLSKMETESLKHTHPTLFNLVYCTTCKRALGMCPFETARLDYFLEPEGYDYVRYICKHNKAICRGREILC